jgi:hypothetical protein
MGAASVRLRVAAALLCTAPTIIICRRRFVCRCLFRCRGIVVDRTPVRAIRDRTAERRQCAKVRAVNGRFFIFCCRLGRFRSVFPIKCDDIYVIWI